MSSTVLAQRRGIRGFGHPIKMVDHAQGWLASSHPLGQPSTQFQQYF
jgi:hypothetical protein